MRKTKSILALPESSQGHLATMGNNILIAIKRRGLTRKEVAEAALMSERTLRSIINGDPNVGVGCIVAVLAILGLDAQIVSIASPDSDEVGIALSIKNLPERVKAKKSKYDI